MANKPAKTRMCISCRAAKGRDEMVRLVRKADGTVSYDADGKKDGRGAYICKEAACIEKAKRERRAERALSCRVPEEVYNELGETYA